MRQTLLPIRSLLQPFPTPIMGILAPIVTLEWRIIFQIYYCQNLMEVTTAEWVRELMEGILGADRGKRNVLDDSTEDVGQLAGEYWYNIVILTLLVIACYIVCGVLLVLGWKKRWHKYEAFHVDHVTSWHYFNDWRVNFIYRVVVIVVCVFIWLWTWLYQTVYLKDAGFYEFMSYYTVWNFTMLIVYFTLSAAMTIFHRFDRLNPKVAHILGNITIVLFNVEVALVFLVDTITWLVLFPYLLSLGKQAAVLNLTSFVMHGINIFFMLIELALNKVEIRLINMVWMVLWASTYVIWAMIYYAVTQVWRYPFLNLWVWYAMFWYFGVFLLHFLYYFLCFGLHKGKLQIIKKYLYSNTSDDGEI